MHGGEGCKCKWNKGCDDGCGGRGIECDDVYACVVAHVEWIFGGGGEGDCVPAAGWNGVFDGVG